MLGGPSTTIAFRRSTGVAFHSAERFGAGFFSAGTGVCVGSGTAAVFVSAVLSGVTITVAVCAVAALESLTGAVMIKGVGGIMTEVASAGPATSGISSAETVDVESAGAAFTIVGEGTDRTSEATPSEGTTASTGADSTEGPVAVAGVGASAGVGANAAAVAVGVASGSSSAGSGNGTCFSGFSGIGIGIGGVVVGAAGVTGVVSGSSGFGSGVGIGAGVASAGTAGKVAAVVPAGVVVAALPA